MSSSEGDIYAADYLRKKRVRKGKVEYLVRWHGYSYWHDCWEPEENILDPLLIENFVNSGRSRRRRKGRRRVATNRRKRGAPTKQGQASSSRGSQETQPTSPAPATPRREGPKVGKIEIKQEMEYVESPLTNISGAEWSNWMKVEELFSMNMN